MPFNTTEVFQHITAKYSSCDLEIPIIYVFLCWSKNYKNGF